MCAKTALAASQEAEHRRTDQLMDYAPKPALHWCWVLTKWASTGLGRKGKLDDIVNACERCATDKDG
jgi:hypothetical protein